MVSNVKLDSRFFKIFNRNTHKEDYYTYTEIQEAFSKTEYSFITDKQRVLYSKFFTECIPDDIENLCSDFKVNKRDIKKMYLTSPYRKIKNIAKVWDSKYRVKSIIVDKILPRDHDKYKCIDDFEIYELTPCIAYEMAIRNKDVKNLLKRIAKVDEAMNELMYVRILRKEIYGKRNNITDEKELDEKYSKYLKYIDEREAIYKKSIEEDYKKYIDDYLDISTEYCSSYLPDLQKRLENELINEFLIYPKGYYRQIPHAISYIKEQINNEKSKLETFSLEENEDVKEDGEDYICKNNKFPSRIERIVHDEFILYQSLYANKDEYIVDNIVPNFRRQVNDQNQTHISINFSLPLKEIVEYITKIKKRINPRTLREFLDEKLEKADNLTKMNTTDKKDKTSTIDAIRGDNPQFKLADMLYIYDMKQLGFTSKNIIGNLNHHYQDKSFDNKTIATYYSLAIDYIDNEKYQELITGKPVI